MRSANVLFVAALAVGVAGTAAAQSGTATLPATPQATNYGETASHWVATGFVGSNFGTSGDSARIDTNAGGVAYGGQVGYLWRGMIGPEFIADFAPTFDISSLAIDNNPRVNSYMANAIGALPLGANGQLMPYISGGFGAIQMAADVFTSTTETETLRQSRWGTNVGGGVMAFASNRIGIRGDVRYYHATTNNTFSGSAEDQVMDGLLSGLAFWRANGGVSFRW